MDPVIKAKWLAALRSGEYRQGLGALERLGRYCCLGVLAHVQDANWRKNYPMVDVEALHYNDGAGLSHEQMLKLARLNDNGKTFLEIADEIEANC